MRQWVLWADSSLEILVEDCCVGERLELLAAELKSGGSHRSWRLIGVGITDLIEPQDVEDDFFGGDERRTLAGEKTADAIRARFGATALTSARALRGKSSAQD